MKLLLDGDILVFRAAFSAEDEEEAWVACSRVDGMIAEMEQMFGTKDTEIWLSGENNFRYNIFPEYKANRLDAKRPKWEKETRQYLIDEWSAKVSEGCEADDMLGVRATELGSESIIATIDKDLDMIPGWHYNFVKKEKYFVDDEAAIRFFYTQCLIGDTADGVKGVPGIGPIKAKKLLDACYEEEDGYGDSLEEQMYWTVRDQFSCYEEFLMTAQVLWIWRKPNDIWKDNFK
jgi:DNA polymerase I